MAVGNRIEKLMRSKGITRYKLSKDTGIPYTTITNIITERTKDPQVSALQVIADYLGVSLDYLLGQSISALIEGRLKELGITMEELSARTKIPLKNLQNLDNLQPGPWDYEPDGLIDRLAKALDMDYKTLASAYARQEPPAYDGPVGSVEDDFESIPMPSQSETELTPKEERDIARELERIMASLESDTALAFDGEPMTDEDRELLRASLNNALHVSRLMAKKKYTPRKYRK